MDSQTTVPTWKYPKTTFVADLPEKKYLANYHLRQKLDGNPLTDQEWFIKRLESDKKPFTVKTIGLEDIPNLTEEVELLKIIIPYKKPIYLQDLAEQIHIASHYVDWFLYIALNKFCVVTSQSQKFSNSYDWDSKVISYIFSKLHRFEWYTSQYNDEDDGTQGNFVYPLTSMVFKRED